MRFPDSVTIREVGGVLLRTVLFAPANHPRRVERLGDFNADAVVLDLEDAVADAEKVRARAAVLPALARYDGPLRCVRVNSLATGLLFGDLDAVVGPGLDVVVVPKVESSAELAFVDVHLERLEAERGLEPGVIRLLPIVESARGILRMEEIAASAGRRVITFLFGIGDYTVDLGIEPTPGAEELVYARTRFVLCCRAYGFAPPVDGPFFIDFEDEDAFVADSRRSRSLGFQGRLVLHPRQVAWANRAYAILEPDELRTVEEVVEAFEAAEREGLASIRVGRRFVDYPIYQLARRRLDRYRAYRRDGGRDG